MPRSRCAVMKLCACALLTFTVAGCGGGGGGSTTTPPPTDSSNPTPTVTSVTPVSATAGAAATPVTISGSGFISSSAIQWNGTALATTFSSATSLQTTIPAGNLTDGVVAKLTVVNPTPGGGTSAVLNFTVNNPVPAITGLSPSTVPSGVSDIQVSATGTGFVPSTTLAWNGTALTTTFVSATQVTVVVPAANLTLGTQATITAQNPPPSGGTSPGAKFNVKGPTSLISSIAPRIIAPGSPATMVTVNGTGFVSTSVVLWFSSPRPTTFVSATQLQVLLSAADLQSPANGTLQVADTRANTIPSAPVSLPVSAGTLPTIQGASITPSSQGFSTTCPNQLAVVITGTQLTSSPVIAANGVSLSPPIFLPGPPAQLNTFLPVGFVAKPGALSFTLTVTSVDNVSLTSDPFAYPASAPAALALCANPSPATVMPATSFSFLIQPSEVNVSGNTTVTLGTLPAGITATATSITVPPAGAPVHLKAANTTVAGTYDIPLKGIAGGVSATGDFNFTVASGSPSTFIFSPGINNEVAVPIGGSGSVLFNSSPSSLTAGVPVIFDVTVSLSALPAGTTATISPTTFIPGQSVTVTLTAASNAPVTKNAAITVTATPASSMPAPETVQILADVTQPPGSLDNSRSDLTPMQGKPNAAAFDAMHGLIFASNPDWNRIDVISDATHKLVKSIPVRAPSGLDVTPDFKHVWVVTESPQIYEIDTTTLQATHFTLPVGPLNTTPFPDAFIATNPLAFSDGTVSISYNDGNGRVGFGVWNPQTNLFSNVSSSVGLGRRSGDGLHAYFTGASSFFAYDVASQTLNPVGGSVASNAVIAGVNSDGSRVIVFNTATGPQLCDNHISVLGTLPGTYQDTSFNFRAVFSSDNKKVYEILTYNNIIAVVTADATTLGVLGVSPAITATPVSGPSGAAIPFAIDSTGLLLGAQNFGIAFDDPTFNQTYVANQPRTNLSGIFDIFSGPITGGTVSTLLTFPPLTPDVWYGQTRGSAEITGLGVQATSPPSTIPGPVNVKFISPDGTQSFNPEAFTYGVVPEFNVLSGSSPNGGAPASLVGFGVPQDVNGGSVAVGGNQATITTVAGSTPPFIGNGSTATILKYTFPPGNPGHADLQVTTPNGTATLAKSVVYAKTVTDHSSSDTFTALLVDAPRHQVYLSAGDHVDVFSTSSNQFVTALHPAAQGATKQFTGLALTPDGTQLLVADLADGSLAVINPDNPSTTLAIPVAPTRTDGNGCRVGPLYVAATSTNLAFVQLGSLLNPGCLPQGDSYVVNLQNRTSSRVSSGFCVGGLGVESSADGNFVALGGPPCVYSAQTATYAQGAFTLGSGGLGVAISGDGNVVEQNQVFGDSNAIEFGSVSHPALLFPMVLPLNLLSARLNASGSLEFTPFSNYFEIADVQHGMLRLRFSLTQTIQGVPTPLAVDAGGQVVYLITDAGLTVVDFGEAPLSIGHLSVQTGSSGTQVTVRGSGFDASVTATVGGVAASVTFVDENTLTLTIPAASTGPQDIVLTRTGTYAESYTLENAIVVQ
jgi:hypothetical protein